MNKQILDELLLTHKAQPVGSGYIDIIVHRDNYKDFLADIIKEGFTIEAVSWWEYITNENDKNTYGAGGPKSKFYSGKFAEVACRLDDVSPNHTLSQIIDIVHNKDFGQYASQLISFDKTPSLTPAFWLNVDKKWKNSQR